MTFAPADNATGIAIDQQLRLTFPSAPKLGTSGSLSIHDAATDAVVVKIDPAEFVTFTLFGGTRIRVRIFRLEWFIGSGKSSPEERRWDFLNHLFRPMLCRDSSS